jgi:hypothetical protein
MVLALFLNSFTLHFHTSRPPPPLTHCINTYPMYLVTQGGVGGGEPVRRLEGAI